MLWTPLIMSRICWLSQAICVDVHAGDRLCLCMWFVVQYEKRGDAFASRAGSSEWKIAYKDYPIPGGRHFAAAPVRPTYRINPTCNNTTRRTRYVVVRLPGALKGRGKGEQCANEPPPRPRGWSVVPVCIRCLFSETVPGAREPFFNRGRVKVNNQVLSCNMIR